MCICLVAKHVTSFLASSQSCLWDRDLVPATCLLRPSGLNPYCQKQGWGRVDPQEVTVEVAETSGISVNLSVSLSGCPSSAVTEAPSPSQPLPCSQQCPGEPLSLSPSFLCMALSPRPFICHHQIALQPGSSSEVLLF